MRWLRRALVAWLLLAPTIAGAEEVVDGIAAQVGNDIVLISEVTQLTAARLYLYQDDDVIQERAYVYSQPLGLEP